MKWFPRRAHHLPRAVLGVCLGIALVALTAQADLPKWIQHLDANGAIRSAFFRLVSAPSGIISARRPPRETRERITSFIEQRPSQADLYSLRALEAEQDLDFDAAEKDWRTYIRLQGESLGSLLELADFYHRRLRPADEIAILQKMAAMPAPAEEKRLAPAQPTSWQLFERILSIMEVHALPERSRQKIYQAWIDRYPDRPAVYEKLLERLIKIEQYPRAAEVLASYEKNFPDRKVFIVRSNARLAAARGKPEDAFRVYEDSFHPIWPASLASSYFRLLQKEYRTKHFLERVRKEMATNPLEFRSAAWLFYYHQQQGNLSAAQQVLAKFRLRREESGQPWRADELHDLAQLFRAVRNYDEAARYYYALYSLPSASADDREFSLAGLINLLLSVPEKPVWFGYGDFSFYRDIATMDPNPGFLNGVLSLLFNSEDPAQEYARQEQSSIAYFHRAHAAEILSLFDSQFPKSDRRPGLHLQLMQSYGTYGQTDGVLRAGQMILDNFPNAKVRTRTALMMADAYSSQRRTEEELGMYKLLLRELSPMASGASIRPPKVGANDWRLQPSTRGQFSRPPGAARSPEYTRVLDRYISRLVSLRRHMDALAVIRKEVDRNPDDPSLYEKLAKFLQQNNLTAEVEEVYRRAIDRFTDRTWHHRLARWYLRQRRTGDFQELSRQVASTFSGSDLEEYVREVGGTGLSARLYLQVNLFAHERFPYDLTFVRNLLSAYQRKETRNFGAWEHLIREYWPYDARLRNQFLAFLAKGRRLESELSSAREIARMVKKSQWETGARSNPANTRFMAEAEVWRSHFEEAAPLLQGLAVAFPADEDISRRAAGIHRSLASTHPGSTQTATSIEKNWHKFQPADRSALTRIGEIYADRELFQEAGPYWRKIAALEPGKPDGYLESATIFWDYYRFDDALEMIAQGRESTGNPALYAYEAGAIYENKRDYEKAVAEYVQGALSGRSGPARSRLLTLAKRPATREMVETGTARPTQDSEPSFEAITLRLAVLDAQERRDGVEELLKRVTKRTTSLNMVVRLEPIASRRGLASVSVAILERRISLMADPVERMRLQIRLARFYEGSKDLQTARRLFEELYRSNPLLLGVVRAAVDFYWRNEMADEAIDTLVAAAGQSYPAQGRIFTWEAAQKSIQAERYSRARDLLAPLLASNPFDSRAVSAYAETYGRENDYLALREFYLDKIEKVRDTDWPRKNKRDRIASLRRALIPSLTLLQEHREATDQYIELINHEPEAAGVLLEAAGYAALHGLQARLVDYYARTAKTSPRDYRWPMILARLHTRFEKFPEAIAAYDRSLEVSPDRKDLREAKAKLQERLLRFQDALASYLKLYELDFNNPQWMLHVAELHVRLGQDDAAIRAYRSAILEGRPKRPENYFSLATILEQRNLLGAARDAVESGLDLAGNDALAIGAHRSGVSLYVRLMARLRMTETSFERLWNTWQANPTKQATNRFRTVLGRMGGAVRTYFTPEQKQAFEEYVEVQLNARPGSKDKNLLLYLAQSAGLADLESRWRFKEMMAAPGSPGSRSSYERLADLQERRLRFEELGAQLEAYWGVYPNTRFKSWILDRAARSYRKAGNEESELRVLSQQFQRASLSGDMLTRYYEQLFARDPRQLVAAARTARSNGARNRAVEFVLEHGDSDLAQQAVRARGERFSPIWTHSYSALAGLYYRDSSQRVRSSFLSALGEEPIGERLAGPPDRKQQHAGDIWAYYGSRYGEYIVETGGADAEHYLPSAMEERPANPMAYLALGDFYAEKRQWKNALAEYEHVLELKPLLAVAHDRIAQVLWQQGKKSKATAQWRTAIRTFVRWMNRKRIDETFWPSLKETLERIGEHKLLPALRDDVDKLLELYIRRNGTYRIEPILRGALAAIGNPSDGMVWLAALSTKAKNSVEFLETLLQAGWLPKEHREPLFRSILREARSKMDLAQGVSRNYARNTLERWQLEWIGYLAGSGRNEMAQAALDSLSSETQTRLTNKIVPLRIRLAARLGRFDALLNEYMKDPATRPHTKLLRQSAGELLKDGRNTESRKLLELIYTQELAVGTPSASAFQGLAAIRLEQKNLADALALLRRMTLVTGSPFEHHGAAARLLSTFKYPNEALVFLDESIRAEPWKTRSQLLRAEIMRDLRDDSAVSILLSVMRNSTAPYLQRLRAAGALEGTKGDIQSDSAELTWLAGTRSSMPALETLPHAVTVRLIAAEQTTDPSEQVRLLMGAVAGAPEDLAPRQTLFDAAIRLERYELAVAAVEPLLNKSRFEYALRQSSSGRRSRRTEYRAQDSAPYFLSQFAVSNTHRARVAGDLAIAFEKTGRLSSAAFFHAVAVELEPDDTVRRERTHRLDRVRAVLRWKKQNQENRPVVTKNLTQPKRVRPRIAAPSNTAKEGARR